MSFKVAMAQIAPRLADVRGNVERHLRWIEEAREKQVDILLFPELGLSGRALGDRAVDVALTLDSAEFADVRRASKELAIGVGLVERGRDRVFRDAYVWLDGGTIVGLHRKVHLESTAAGHEARFLSPGRSFRAFDTRRGRIGLLVGADARHVAAAGLLALQGIDALVAPLAVEERPHAEPSPEGDLDVWPRALAGLLRCHVYAVNRVGAEEGRLFAGRSRACGPDGSVLAEGDAETEGLILTTLDHDASRRARLEESGPRDEARDVLLRELRRVLRES
jgi:predicted amidohydrolase